MSAQDPTSDYRKYPKGPNFLLIVILSSVILVILMVSAVILVKERGKTLDPHRPNPRPNALLLPHYRHPSVVPVRYNASISYSARPLPRAASYPRIASRVE